jgi:hypothetical protein
LRYYRGVHVHYATVAFRHLTCRLFEKYVTGSVFPTGIRVRKKLADVPFSNRPENGITDRMHQDISVRVTFQSLLVRNLYPSENQFSSRHQLVYVVSNAYVNHAWGSNRSGRRLSMLLLEPLHPVTMKFTELGVSHRGALGINHLKNLLIQLRTNQHFTILSPFAEAGRPFDTGPHN